MKQNVTMKDIADCLGVSKVTVSKALNDKEGVSDKLKAKIIEEAKKQGYHMNLNAKSLRSNCSYNIGVIIPEQFTNTGEYYRGTDEISYYMNIYQILSNKLYEKNFSAILHILSTKDEENNIIPRLYSDKKVDGFIVLGQVRRAYVQLLETLDIPTVYMDFYDDYLSMDSVNSDNFLGCHMATNYLIEKGHRDIAFVGNVFYTSSIQDRFLGFYKSLLENRIMLAEDYIVCDRDDKGRYIRMVYPSKMPTAFVCNCDQVAYELVNQLKCDGFRVPEDISVVGFDNSRYSNICNPNITTVEENTENMTKETINVLFKKIENPNYHVGKILVKGELIVKNSVLEYKEKDEK